MSKIDTTGWKEFKVGDLFSAVRGTSKIMREIEDGEVPIIAAARANQGIAKYGNIKPEYQNEITVSCNGVGCGSTFYHDGEFAISGDAMVLLPKYEISKETKIALAAVMDAKFFRKYSYEDKISPDKIKEEAILLPIKEEYEPDWEYMENYMKKILQESEENLENLRNANDTKHQIDVDGWGEFHLYDDHMFDIDMGNKFDRSKMDASSNDINFIGRTGVNNGINAVCARYNDIQPYEPGNLTLALGGTVGACFVQEKRFYTSQNVVVLRPKDDISLEAKQFVAAVIYQESSLHYQAFVKELNKHIKTDFTVRLPKTITGEPDWQYMESYMRSVMKKTENIIENLDIL